MKKVVVLIVLALVVWLGYNYFQTGEVSLFPRTVSAEEKALTALEKDLADVNAQMAQAGRAAGMTGMDTTSDVSALMAKKDQLEKQISEARKKLIP